MDDWLESREFYELCQVYRHVNQRVWVGDDKTVAAFEALKEFIREKSWDDACRATSTAMEQAGEYQ